MADEPDESLPYLPASEPTASPRPAEPTLPPTLPTTTPAPPSPPSPVEPAGRGILDAPPGESTHTDEADVALTAAEMAVRNVPASRPRVDYGLPAAPPAGALPPTQPEFVRPELVPMATSTTALLIGRGLMVVAMLLVGVAARRSAGVGAADRGDAFWPVVVSAGVFTTVAVAGLVFWSVSLADNAERLKARTASPKSMGWMWALPVAWVAVSALTYLRVETDGDLNPLPGVAGLGLALALAVPYARLQGIFRKLSRRPPVLWLSAYPLDLAAFGLVWWRLTSWPDPVTGADWDHVRLTANIAFGAAAVLAVNGLVFGWLAQRGANGVYERLGRLEARNQPDDGMRPEWFASGLRVQAGARDVEARPLISTTALTPVVSLFHILWGLSTIAFGIALARLAFDYSDRPAVLGESLRIDDSDNERIGFVASVVVLVYVLTIIVHGVWAVLVALNARRVTVHAPNPATFGIIFAPMPVLVVAGLLIGGTVGYWLVLAGLGFAFFALLLVNRMLMALSARLGGALKGFSTWTLIITLVYLVGVAENFLFSEAASRLGFFATATFMQGVLIMAGGVFGFRAMQALEETLRTHRQTRRAEPT